MLGFRARTSALLATMLATYVLGVPQCFGKITHTSPCLVWFGAILAASNCADVLSIDALIDSRRRADRGITEPPANAKGYALPLTLVWMLMGICVYFFPGFWKLTNGGENWFLSNNLQYLMYNDWIMHPGGFHPLFRLDKFPLLCHLSAVATVTFELSFIWLVFSSAGRKLLIPAGLLFHTILGLFMGVNFISVQICYAALVNWNDLFHRLGRKLFAQELSVIYDANDIGCRRLIAAVRVFDFLGRINYVTSSSALVAATPASSASDDKPLRFVVGNDYLDGFDGLHQLAKRIPIFWPLLPLCKVPLLRNRVEQLTVRVQASATASVTAPIGTRERIQGPELIPVLLVGGLLLGLNSYLGCQRIPSGWPCTCYPLFDRLVTPESKTITLKAFDANHNEITVAQPMLQFRANRWHALSGKIIGTQDRKRRRRMLKALWQFWRENDDSTKNASEAFFYADILTSVPERRCENPLKRTLLLHITQ